MECGGRFESSHPDHLMPPSSVGRAPSSEGGCPRFDPASGYQIAARGQGGHGPVCKTGRDGFNSRSRIQLAPVARMDRRRISTRVYAGSNPAWSANRLRVSADERPHPRRDDTGSTPVAGSNDTPFWRVNRRGLRRRRAKRPVGSPMSIMRSALRQIEAGLGYWQFLALPRR